MAQYRVWQMDMVVESNDHYRDSVVEVIGTPFGLQDVVMDEDQFRDFKIGVDRMNYYERQHLFERRRFFYQKIQPNPNEIVGALIKEGREFREQQELSDERRKKQQAEEEAEAKKRKEARERKKFEQMKAKFEGKA